MPYFEVLKNKKTTIMKVKKTGNRAEVTGATEKQKRAVQFINSCGTAWMRNGTETGERVLFTSAGHQIEQNETDPEVWEAYEAIISQFPKGLWGYKVVFN